MPAQGPRLAPDFGAFRMSIGEPSGARCRAGAAAASASDATMRYAARVIRSRLRVVLEESVHLPLRIVLRPPIALLDLAGEDLGIAVNLVEVVVGELAPLLAHLPFQLFPLSLEGFLVHCFLLQPMWTDRGVMQDRCRRRRPPTSASSVARRLAARL